MKIFVTVEVQGVVLVHLPHTTNNYATLCGLDGDDPHFDTQQKTIPTKSGAKVDCPHCKAIFKVATKYRLSDFA